jgi:hypothetical protein
LFDTFFSNFFASDADARRKAQEIEDKLNNALCEQVERAVEEAKPKWISVENRLPEFHTFCSIFDRFASEAEPALYTAKGWVDLNQSALSSGSLEFFSGVIYWQPLPLKPK